MNYKQIFNILKNSNLKSETLALNQKFEQLFQKLDLFAALIRKTNDEFWLIIGGDSTEVN